MNGPGLYNAVATAVRQMTGAKGVILIVVAGELGDGFEVQLPPESVHRMPRCLREIADKMEQDLASGPMVVSVAD
jgi:hypothetical protein